MSVNIDDGRYIERVEANDNHSHLSFNSRIYEDNIVLHRVPYRAIILTVNGLQPI